MSLQHLLLAIINQTLKDAYYLKGKLRKDAIDFMESEVFEIMCAQLNLEPYYLRRFIYEKNRRKYVRSFSSDMFFTDMDSDTNLDDYS